MEYQEIFARDLLAACCDKDPSTFKEKFDTLKSTEKSWLMRLADFMINNGWKKG